MNETKSWVTSRDGTRIAVYVGGASGGETVLLVHGFPDTHTVFDHVAERLAPMYRVVRYDVRGAGASDRPTRTEDYVLDRLVDDAEAVLREVAPKGKVHLVGHDWGSIQGWEIAYRLADRFASFVSISGPCLDHVATAFAALRADADARRYAADQFFRSWYITVLANPALAGRLIGPGVRAKFAGDLERFEELAPDPHHPAATLHEDALAGSRLYAANMFQRLGAPRPRPIRLPVKLIVPMRDRFVSARTPDVTRPFVPDLTVQRLDAGHWCVRARPDVVTSAIVEHLRAHPAR